jgi:signal recognition particle subunit SEC65
MLRVARVESETELEEIRDLLDVLGIEYEHVRSEPEDSYPQAAYFYIPDEAAGDVEYVISEKHGYDAEVL